jgi:hypothetical protein
MKPKKTLWRKVADSKVRHVWISECSCSKDEVVHVSPTFYAEAGIPCCKECGADFEYSHTEIKEASRRRR